MRITRAADDYWDKKKIKQLIGQLDLSVLAEMMEDNIEKYQPIQMEPFILGFSKRSTAVATLARFHKEFPADEDGLLILTIYLAAALYVRDILYKPRQISDQIFFETYSCFKKEVDKNQTKHGKYQFLNSWWTYRQVCGSLFRLGILEFEMFPFDLEIENSYIKKNDLLLSVHIPVNAPISSEKTRECYFNAFRFFRNHFSEFKYKAVYCNSWMLSPYIRKALKPTSKILAFAGDYTLINVTQTENHGAERVFDQELVMDQMAWLPERTSLQKGMKRMLENGEKTGNGIGIMIYNGKVVDHMVAQILFENKEGLI